MTDGEQSKTRRFPQITRNRLIAIGIVVAGFVAISALNPDIARSIVQAIGG